MMRMIVFSLILMLAGCSTTTKTIVTVKSITKDVDHSDWSGDLVVYRIECDKATVIQRMHRQLVVPVGEKCFLVRTDYGGKAEYSFEFLETCD